MVAPRALRSLDSVQAPSEASGRQDRHCLGHRDSSWIVPGVRNRKVLSRSALLLRMLSSVACFSKIILDFCLSAQWPVRSISLPAGLAESVPRVLEFALRTQVVLRLRVHFVVESGIQDPVRGHGWILSCQDHDNRFHSGYAS